jgi:hypothetical protein
MTTMMYGYHVTVPTALVEDAPALSAMVIEAWRRHAESAGHRVGDPTIRVLKEEIAWEDPETGEMLDPEVYRFVLVEGPVLP